MFVLINELVDKLMKKLNVIVNFSTVVEVSMLKTA